MSDPFIHLKKSMKKNVFKDYTFSNERKQAVKETIAGAQSEPHCHSWKEETIIAVLKLVQQEAKHGYDISTHLFQRNEYSFQNNEGQLYTLLHLLENKEILTSKWITEKKYYSLSNKGRKCIAAYKQGSSKQRISLKQLIEEVSL